MFLDEKWYFDMVCTDAIPKTKGPDSPSFMGQKYQETQDQILGTTQKVDFSHRTNS